MKASFIFVILSAGMALAAPTPTAKGEPTQPESYGSEQSVTRRAWKRHMPEAIQVEERTPTEESDPTQSVSHYMWKRAVPEEIQVEERTPTSEPDPYQSVSTYPHKREVEAMPAPEHFEVLTA